jgi:hypothetical protein
LNIPATAAALDLQILQVNGAKGQAGKSSLSIGDVSIGVVGKIPIWNVSDQGAVRLEIPASDKPIKLKLLISRCDAKAMAGAMGTTAPPEDLSGLCKGGPARYPEKIILAGTPGKTAGAFIVEDIPFPAKNPWNARMRFGGFDFFKDGRSAAVCTWDGDVWLVSGIDEQLQKVTWQRIATGLFQPLGLKIVANAKGEEEIFVSCRDQIVRLHDFNNDGEADFYECFNGDHQVTEHFHEFAMGLQTDAEGNFYYAKAARHALDAVVPQHGTILKVASDGSGTEIVCNGFRAPNGIGIGPRGEIITSDQEGFWMPANRINLVKPGGFYGNLWSLSSPPRKAADGYDPPLCWLPGPLDRSPAEDLWVSSDKWGSLKGRILHTSYGAGYISLVMHEMIDGVPQGGVVQLLPHKFGTGIMRGRFNAADGQLYVCGLVGWSSNSADPGGFYRVRYGGGALRLPIDLRVSKDGVAITFADPLDKASAEDVGNYAARRWNYRWTQNYGSKHYRVSDPAKEGQDDVVVTAASLSADGKTVLLKLEDLRPVMQMRIDLDIKAADGGRVKTTIHQTINRI